MINSKRFIILIGRSGSGKGTQAKLLAEVLRLSDQNEVLHFTTGGSFRDFLNTPSYSANLSKEIVNSGGLMPEFLAIWNWSNIFINKLEGAESIILDGAPRKVIEISALNTAINFYGYLNPVVIYLDVSESWAKLRLSERGREDDSDLEDIERKMNWFDVDVLPCIDWYKNIDKRYTFVHINGERSIEAVHSEIISKLQIKHG